MSQARFRQIARLEKLVQPYLKRTRQIEEEWQRTIRGAVSNATVLAFLIRYGDPKIGEPLSCAWERFTNTHVWKECCDNWEDLASLTRAYQGPPYGRDNVLVLGMYLRHALIARFSGATEKKKLERVFASAPPWLIWFTFGDYTAELLGFSIPDLSSVTGFARSKADFDNWYGPATGAFVPRRWLDGPDNEPLARTDLNLLPAAMEGPISPKTRREHRRAHASYMKSRSAESTEDWPRLAPLEVLTMPFDEAMELISEWRNKRDT
jgi:hypothetical protein